MEMKGLKKISDFNINLPGMEELEIKEASSNSLLVIASKKLIIPDSHIIVDKNKELSLRQYQPII